jgi:ATP-dependent Clp protease ATP-binding subunit ClpC
MIAPGAPAQSPASASGASADHGAALVEGNRLASFTGRPAGTADVLLGLLRAGGAAARLLAERGVTAPRLEALLHQVHPEQVFSVEHLARASHEIASGLGARQTSSLHLLLALLRAGGGAVELLRLGGQEPTRLRAVVLRALTGPSRVSERARPREPGASGPGPAARGTGHARVLHPLVTSAVASGPAAAPVVGIPAASSSIPAPAIAPTPASAITPAAAPAPESAGGDLLPVDPPSSPVLYREREIGRLLDLLSAPSQRVVCIVGDPGTGRSAVVAALAGALADKPLAPTGAPAGGTSPGMWIESLHRQAPAGVPLVLDGCSALTGEGSDGPAQLLAAARAGRRWLLTASPADLRRLELGSPELASALETVALSPLNSEAVFDVVESGLGHLAASCNVEFSADACKALLRLAPRYPSELGQPGRALTIAGVATARATRLGQARVNEAEIAEVVAAAADIPVVRLIRSDDERFRTLEERLADRVVGHDQARARIADVLRRSYAGFRGGRPLASFLLLGPTGVGKTETARAIADALFDGESALLRIDLSEYSEPHAIARLIGSPPGYVGYEEGGQLTEGIRRRPASVVLLDELEKAHREVLLVLLQVLEDGRLTDGRGRTVDFSAAAIVMTSNLGSECYKARARVPSTATILGVARTRLPPELWNRIDETLCYAPLKEAELAGIIARFARESSRRLESERGISFTVDDDVVAEVLDAETDRSLGARPLRRAFERLVEGPIASRIVAGNLRPGSRLRVSTTRQGEITVTLAR